MTERIIEARSGWHDLDWRELWDYRDLFYFLVTRDVKVRYAQSVLGVGWAVLQPLLQALIFTVIFGNLAKIGSDGIPYMLFSFTAMVPWTYFANGLNDSTSSLIKSSQMISKIYFPRITLPIAAILAKLIDFSVALLVLSGLLIFYQTSPTWMLLTLPLLTVLMVMTTIGVGTWFTALSLQYRDVSYGMQFLVRLLIYTAPVVYPTSLIPEQYHLLYALNPMVGVIEGFRSALIGVHPMPWHLVGVGAVTATVLFVSGILYFQRVERVFADVA
ncbi:MAG: ABC transporter permease [Chloroflexaceae bacterium]|nr:ABC transporter permease [Chloroflexaceae bacterium]